MLRPRREDLGDTTMATSEGLRWMFCAVFGYLFLLHHRIGMELKM